MLYFVTFTQEEFTYGQHVINIGLRTSLKLVCCSLFDIQKSATQPNLVINCDGMLIQACS